MYINNVYSFFSRDVSSARRRRALRAPPVERPRVRSCALVRPSLPVTHDSSIQHSRVMTRQCAPPIWMDHIYPVVVRPGRPHVDARASEADDWRASGAFGRRGSVLSVHVRARASVARGVEERARGHRPRDREIRAGVSEARARAVSSEMTSASASVRARWTPSAVARANQAAAAVALRSFIDACALFASR